MRKSIVAFFAVAALACLASCSKSDELKPEPAAAPVLLSTEPADGAVDLKGEKLTLKLTYDQNIKCNSLLTGKVAVDNDAVIDKINA